jgi:hypothetical protein
MAESSTAAAPPAGKTVAVAAATAIPTTAIVHPLVLLSATDHYMRVAKDTKKRVVGVLLGSKEVAGERDTWKTTTHENAVRTLPAHDAPQILAAKMCGRNVLLECFRQHQHLSMLQCMLKWMGGRGIMSFPGHLVAEEPSAATVNPLEFVARTVPGLSCDSWYCGGGEVWESDLCWAGRPRRNLLGQTLFFS